MLTAPPFERRVWRRSVFLAAFLHLAVGALVLFQFGAPDFDAAISTPFPVNTLEITESPETPGADLPHDSGADATVNSASPGDTAVEPGFDYVRRAADAIRESATRTAGPDALADLERKARLIEEISTPAEIAKITSHVRAALGANALTADEAPQSPAHGSRRFDFDRCIVVNAERFERAGEVEIRETLRDRSGNVIHLSYIRRTDPKTGAVTCFQTQQPAEVDPPIIVEISVEEFVEAEARQRPYDVINRFGLLQQIHRQAVLPLIDKFAEEETEPAAPATQPAN